MLAGVADGMGKELTTRHSLSSKKVGITVDLSVRKISAIQPIHASVASGELRSENQKFTLSLTPYGYWRLLPSQEEAYEK